MMRLINRTVGVESTEVALIIAVVVLVGYGATACWGRTSLPS